MSLLSRSPALAAPLLVGLALAATPEPAPPEITAPLLPGEPTRVDLGRAREVLETWENGSPEKAARRLQVVYWTPADRDPQPDYRARLTRVMRHLEDFYRAQLTSYGFPGRSIRLDTTADGLLNLHMAKGTLKSAECSETDSSDGQAIRRDCLRALQEAGMDGAKETMVIFCNLTEWDPDKRTMSHHSPYYASGDSRGGTAWQLDSALLDPRHLPVKDQFLTDQQYGRISLGKYNSIFVGGVCHEVGHALGLPHCRECEVSRRERGTALMGGGNRTYGDEQRGEGKGSFLTVPHALKLAAHPQFSGSVKQLAVKADVTFSQWRMESSGDGLAVSGKLASNLPVHAVLAYADPAGGGDYDAAIAAAVPLPDGRFSLVLPPAQTRSKAAVLSFVGVCANGAATASVWTNQAFSVGCSIDASGRYDITRTLASLEVAEHASAARQGTLAPEILTTLNPVAREALQRLSRPDNTAGKPAPDAAPAELKQLPLSDAAPAKARTGYGGVHYDRTDDGGPLLGPAGPAAHGLWAHAGSSFSYQLGSQWSTLTGSCALLQSGSGPVVARIALDGKTVWESGDIAPGVDKPFSVDLTGGRELVLEIKGQRGIGSAHGAWLEPVLRR